VRIGILLFEGAEELDWAGPWEVLTAWATRRDLDRDVEVVTLAATTDPVTCAKGLRVLPDRSVDDAGALDVVLVPGGQGTYGLIEDEGTHNWLRSLAADGTLVTSVCTGSLVLAAAGLLENRPATIWWGALDRLGMLDPTIDVRPDDRFVDSGEVVTAAGVSAGIDMALHLVARLDSPDRAREVRRYIQYDPEPPV
jgi:transcriptional regulator GlxA family with amidase domain